MQSVIKEWFHCSAQELENITVMTEYFPSETGALPGIMLGLQVFHYGSGLSKTMVLSF